ncbi:MAG TPA: hypothetical protein VG222_04745 [Vicinamibacterales bacterium]|nr:hypothetical protein [Vicinamibacterales bacterium]
MPYARLLSVFAFAFAFVLAPARAQAQENPSFEPPLAIDSAQTAVSQTPPLSAVAYVPITGVQRVHWIVAGTIGPRSLAVGVLADAWQTGFNAPEEWGRSWSGIGNRYLEREADVAISSTIEAGVGAIWGEDPRYVPSGRLGLWPRVRYALKTVVLAQRPDGHLAPAWGRYAGNVFNNVIENAWLPPSTTTTGQTVFRSVNGFLGRAGGNLFGEFWPDVRRRLQKK